MGEMIVHRGLICISLISSDIDHIFRIIVSHLCVFFWEIFLSIVHILIGLFVSLLSSFWSSFYTLHINFHVGWIVCNFFSHSVCCLLLYWWLFPLLCKMFLVSYNPICPLFTFVAFTFGDLSKKVIVYLMSSMFTPCFLSNFIAFRFYI
jgi:hypothetical protein